MKHGTRASIWLAAFTWLFLTPTGVPSASADVYHFVDEHGTLHLTNVPADPRYRKLQLEPRRTPPRLQPDDIDQLITRHSQRQGLHPALLRAVIKTESDFNPAAVSRAGAIGLMQLMPETAVMLSVTNPFDPEQNVRGGAAHLRALLDRFGGKLTFALAAYNAGAGAVERYQALPPYRETRRYVSKVLGHYRRYLTTRSQPARRALTPSLTSARQPSLVFSAHPTR